MGYIEALCFTTNIMLPIVRYKLLWHGVIIVEIIVRNASRLDYYFEYADRSEFRHTRSPVCCCYVFLVY